MWSGRYLRSPYSALLTLLTLLYLNLSLPTVYPVVLVNLLVLELPEAVISYLHILEVRYLDQRVNFECIRIKIIIFFIFTGIIRTLREVQLEAYGRVLLQSVKCRALIASFLLLGLRSISTGQALSRLEALQMLSHSLGLLK